MGQSQVLQGQAQGALLEQAQGALLGQVQGALLGWARLPGSCSLG